MLLNQDNNTEHPALSLRELNLRVKAAISNAMAGALWLRAETSDVRLNQSSGHCYLEFVEKNTVTGQIVAKARASIWAKTFNMLKPYFEKETGQAFTSGITVLVKVSVDFHELYGYSLTVYDIDPSYTLGDMARKRLEIVRRLKEDGVFTLNKELPFPTLPKRIAVITSPTAAGYEDFMNQLTHNKAGYPFYVKLFPALMQGDKTEGSVIAALDRIYEYADLFDVTVIIRGGGATSDLNSFDSYMLAANCAQFPLPIISGIGHERDDTVVDMVAHTRMKTPTAVAEFIINSMDAAAEEVEAIQQYVSVTATAMLTEQKNLIRMIVDRLPVVALNRIERGCSQLQLLGSKLPNSAFSLLTAHSNRLNDDYRKVQRLTGELLTEKWQFIQLTEQFIRMASPDYILKRGYSLTLKEGKIVKRAEDMKAGETFTTRFADGEVNAIVNEIIKNDI
jgi:Exonuclease VII, large subunit